MLCLGLDPGRAGGALLALDGRAVAAAHWHTYTRAKAKRLALVCATAAGPVQQQRGLVGAHAVGMALRTWLAPWVALHGGSVVLACEAAHMGRNARTGLALARWGGALAGPLEQWTEGVVAWVEPNEWRKASFRRNWWTLQAAEAGLFASMAKATREATQRHPGGGGDRQALDRQIKATARQLFMPQRVAAKAEAEQCLPALVPGLADLVARIAPEAGSAEHVIDAAGVCRWRWVQEEACRNP